MDATGWLSFHYNKLTRLQCFPPIPRKKKMDNFFYDYPRVCVGLFCLPASFRFAVTKLSSLVLLLLSNFIMKTRLYKTTCGQTLKALAHEELNRLNMAKGKVSRKKPALKGRAVTEKCLK